MIKRRSWFLVPWCSSFCFCFCLLIMPHQVISVAHHKCPFQNDPLRGTKPKIYCRLPTSLSSKFSEWKTQKIGPPMPHTKLLLLLCLRIFGDSHFLSALNKLFLCVWNRSISAAAHCRHSKEWITTGLQSRKILEICPRLTGSIFSFIKFRSSNAANMCRPLTAKQPVLIWNLAKKGLFGGRGSAATTLGPIVVTSRLIWAKSRLSTFLTQKTSHTSLTLPRGTSNFCLETMCVSVGRDSQSPMALDLICTGQLRKTSPG